MKQRIIRLTESQLREVEDATNRFSMDDPIPSYQQDQVCPNGKLDMENFGDPTTTDDTSSAMTVNWPLGVRNLGGA